MIIQLMNSNKKHISKKTINKKIIPSFLHQTTKEANSIIEKVLSSVSQQIQIIEREKRQRAKELKFAKIKCEEYFQSYLNQMLVDCPITSTFQKDQPPLHIEIDSLAKACLHQISPENTPKNLKKIQSHIQEACSQFKASKFTFSKQRSIRLPLQIIQEMKTINEFRQRKIDDELQKKRQIEILQQERIKNQRRANSLAVSVNFDYNGKILYTKKVQQGNIINKELKLKLSTQKIVKKVNKSPQASGVLPIIKKKSLKKIKSKVFEDQFTEFLDGQSLTDSIEINKGIRYSHNFLVFQQKKSVASTSQLKSQLGKKKISKDEFSKIREFDEKQQSKRVKKIKTELFKQSRFSQKRSYSQANLHSFLNKKRDTINVMNPQLRSSMLIRLSQYQPYLVIQKELPQDSTLFYNQKQEEPSQNLSIVSKNQLQNHSKLAESVRMTPLLPPIHRSRKLPSYEDDLIITKLQQQLQNKLRI